MIGAFGSWSQDGRADVIISEDLQAQIDELTARAQANPEDVGAISAELSALMAQAQSEAAIVIDGVSSDGAQLGIWTMALGVVAAATSLAGIGLFGREEHKLWVWNAITAGVGVGIALIAFNWIFTFVRHTDPNFISGVGSFITLMGGAFVLASTMSVLSEFRRSKVYDDEPATDAGAAAREAEETIEELV